MEAAEGFEREPDGEFELPAIFVGARGIVEASVATDAPWLFAFSHQCGGLSCLQEPIVGVVLPLAWNLDGDAATEVVRGLDALGADSPHAARTARLPNELAPLHLTSGKPYLRKELDALEAWLAPALSLPHLVKGTEAFIELAACDLLKTFGDWRALSADASRVMLGDSIRDWSPVLAGARARWDGATRFDATLLDSVERVFARAGVDTPARAFLLWGNSD